MSGVLSKKYLVSLLNLLKMNDVLRRRREKRVTCQSFTSTRDDQMMFLGAEESIVKETRKGVD